MGEIKADNGFDFYETLRYFLPGLLLVFLLGYVAFPEYSAKYSFPEKLAFGILLGFAIHSFSMYKLVPGTTRMRKQFHENAKKTLKEIDDIYLRWDMTSIVMTSDEEHFFRRYFALGAFKLDMVFVMLFFLVYYITSVILKTLIYSSSTGINIEQILIILLLCLFIYTLRDDGLNDLKRSFNFRLLMLLKYKEKEEMKNIINIAIDNKDVMIIRERTFLHPTDIVVGTITKIFEEICKIKKN